MKQKKINIKNRLQYDWFWQINLSRKVTSKRAKDKNLKMVIAYTKYSLRFLATQSDLTGSAKMKHELNMN